MYRMVRLSSSSDAVAPYTEDCQYCPRAVDAFNVATATDASHRHSDLTGSPSTTKTHTTSAPFNSHFYTHSNILSLSSSYTTTTGHCTMSQSNNPPRTSPALTPLTRTRARVVRLPPATSTTTPPTGITDDEAFAAAHQGGVFIPPPAADELVNALSRRGWFRLASSLYQAQAAPYTPPPKPAPAPTNTMSRAEQVNTRSPPASQQQTLGIGRAPPITPPSPQRNMSDPVATRPAAVDMNRSISAPAALPPIFVFGAGVQQAVPAPIHPSFDFNRKSDASSSPTSAQPGTSTRRVSNPSSLATNQPDSPPRRVSSTASSITSQIDSLSRRTSDASSSREDTSESRSPPRLAFPSYDESEPLSQPRRAPDHPEEPQPKRTKLTKPRKSTTWATGDTFLMPSDRGMTFKVHGEQLWMASPKLRRQHLSNKKHMVTFTHPLETAENIEMTLNFLLKRQPPAKAEAAIPLLRLLKHWECDNKLKDLSNLAWCSLDVGGLTAKLAFQIAAEADDYELAFRVVPDLCIGEEFDPVLAQPSHTRRYYLALRYAYIDTTKGGGEHLQQAWGRRMREMRSGTATPAPWTRK